MIRSVFAEFQKPLGKQAGITPDRPMIILNNFPLSSPLSVKLYNVQDIAAISVLV